jgi:predicted TIM-barrel fold metal-dependent hydrolase
MVGLTAEGFHNLLMRRAVDALEHAGELVGAMPISSRLLFGSDWPVCLAGVSYARWMQTAEGALSALSVSERSAVLGENALRLYRL